MGVNLRGPSRKRGVSAEGITRRLTSPVRPATPTTGVGGSLVRAESGEPATSVAGFFEGVLS